VGPRLVPFDAHHGDAVRALIGGVFAEYGMTFDPDDFDADLHDVPGHYLAGGGIFAVLVDGGEVIGTTAAVPRSDTTCEIKRVYLHARHRGKRYGRVLIEHVLGWAAERGFHEVVAWSDARLETAHRVYERLGFEVFGERTVEDIDRSREYGFRLRLQTSGAGRSDFPIR
jgi:putative acetyltransferase